MSAHPVLHPLIAQALAAHQVIPVDSPEHPDSPVRKAAYIQALQSMDWLFDFSDDYSVFRRGKEALQDLRHERALVDADGALWRQHAHPDFKDEVRA